jgi:hypothetical protein
VLNATQLLFGWFFGMATRLQFAFVGIEMGIQVCGAHTGVSIFSRFSLRVGCFSFTSVIFMGFARLD